MTRIQFSATFLCRWFLIAASISVIGIFFSRAMISIGMIGIVLLYILGKGWEKKNSFTRNDLTLFFLAPVFILYIIGGLWTHDCNYWIERVQVKIPLLFVPFGFLAIKEMISRRSIDIVFLLFLFLSFATAMGSFIYYLMHFAEITESYKSAKTIPTIIEHIRYSLMLVLAFFVSVQLYLSQSVTKFQFEKKLVAGMGIFIFIFLHILSVRSGLLALYTTALVWLFIIIIKKKDKRFLLLIPVVILFPVFMYLFIPSMQNKVNYMIHDVNRFVSGKSVNNYSDGNRLLSMKIGTEIGLEHPFIGVGSGDLEKEMGKVYEKEYPDMEQRNWLIPHNQFVYIFAALGFLGLIIFLICLVYPILQKEVMDNILCVASIVSVYTSFLSESTLELQQGVALISLFFSLAYLRRIALS